MDDVKTNTDNSRNIRVLICVSIGEKRLFVMLHPIPAMQHLTTFFDEQILRNDVYFEHLPHAAPFRDQNRQTLEFIGCDELVQRLAIVAHAIR